MASIDAYETKAGKRYMVRYRTPDRKPAVKRGFKNKRDANDWLAENTVKMNTGAWRAESAGRITVADAARSWLESKRASVTPGTMSNYTTGVKHITETGRLGNFYLKDVTHESIEEWVLELSKAVKPKTVRNSFGALNGVMKRALRDKRIASNPCEGVELPRVEKKEMTVPTIEQVRIMAEAAGKHSEIVLFLAMTGLRWGELAGLQVQDVNLNAGRLHIRRQLTGSSGKLSESLPKYGKKRIVPLIAQAKEIVASRIKNKSHNALVFTTERGSALRNQNARRDWFNEAAKQAGLEGLTPHELRHTFASIAIASGANVKALQQALGHHSAAFTLDQYGHLFPDDLGSFITVMDKSFSVECDQKVIKTNP